MVLTANGGPARLLRNDGGTGHHWVRLRAGGRRQAEQPQRDRRPGGGEGRRPGARREVAGARGYLSQSELPLTFGLGKAKKVDKVTVRWPGKEGGKQVLKDLKADAVHVIEQKWNVFTATIAFGERRGVSPPVAAHRRAHAAPLAATATICPRARRAGDWGSR